MGTADFIISELYLWNALQDLAKRSTDTSINTLPQSNIKFLIIPNTMFGD